MERELSIINIILSVIVLPVLVFALAIIVVIYIKWDEIARMITLYEELMSKITKEENGKRTSDNILHTHSNSHHNRHR